MERAQAFILYDTQAAILYGLLHREIELADAQNSANSDADYIAQLEEKAKELD